MRLSVISNLKYVNTIIGGISKFGSMAHRHKSVINRFQALSKTLNSVEFSSIGRQNQTLNIAAAFVIRDTEFYYGIVCYGAANYPLHKTNAFVRVWNISFFSFS